VAGRGTVVERGDFRRGSGRVGTGGGAEGGMGDLVGETRGEDDAGGGDEAGSGELAQEGRDRLPSPPPASLSMV
jgi:hypothetical protein